MTRRPVSHTVSRTVILVTLSALALAGCGNRRALKPASGHSLPPAPYGSGYRPGPDQLLKPRVEAEPERNVDVRTRSEERADDPFDLPPEN